MRVKSRNEIIFGYVFGYEMFNFKDNLTRIVESGYLPEDNAETRQKKAALTLVPLIIGPAAFILGSIYFYLGHPLSAYQRFCHEQHRQPKLPWYYKALFAS